jgi:hypothetical protein
MQRSQLGDFALQARDSLLQTVHGARHGHGPARGGSRGRSALLGVLTQKLRVALLLLPRPPAGAGRQLALDQLGERLVDGGEIGERVHPLGALLELPRGLRSA